MSEPSSLTDIANLSLSLLGERPINNIDTQNTSTAQLLRRFMPVVIREVQETIFWHELYTGPVTLTAVTDDFAGIEGQYQYLLPTDFLQVYEATSRSEDTDLNSVDVRNWVTPWWKLENGFLIARTSEFVMMYGRYDEDVSKWSVQQREVIYYSLAAKIAFPVTNDLSIKQTIEQDLARLKMKVLVSNQNKGRSYRTRPQYFGMASARNAPWRRIGGYWR